MVRRRSCAVSNHEAQAHRIPKKERGLRPFLVSRVSHRCSSCASDATGTSCDASSGGASPIRPNSADGNNHSRNRNGASNGDASNGPTRCRRSRPGLRRSRLAQKRQASRMPHRLKAQRRRGRQDRSMQMLVSCCSPPNASWRRRLASRFGRITQA